MNSEPKPQQAALDAAGEIRAERERRIEAVLASWQDASDEEQRRVTKDPEGRRIVDAWREAVAKHERLVNPIRLLPEQAVEEIQAKITLDRDLNETLERLQDELRAVCRRLGMTGEPQDRAPAALSVAGVGDDASKPKGEWLARAMLLVQAKPHLSDAAIAREIHTSASNLSRSRGYGAAAALARNPGTRTRGVNPSEKASRASAEDEELDARIDAETPKRNATRNSEGHSAR